MGPCPLGRTWLLGSSNWWRMRAEGLKDHVSYGPGSPPSSKPKCLLINQLAKQQKTMLDQLLLTAQAQAGQKMWEQVIPSLTKRESHAVAKGGEE